MLQECRAVSDVAQNYTTQTGFWAVFSKNISFRPSSFSLFNKGLWNKNKRKQKQQRTDSPFSIKGATHLMILMHINNHAKHIRTRQTNLPTSSRFPLVSWPCDPWCYTNRDPLATSPGVVTQCLPNPTRCTAWSLGSVPCRCALAVPYSNLRYWHKRGKIMGHTFVVSPKFPPRFPVFFPDV